MPNNPYVGQYITTTSIHKEPGGLEALPLKRDRQIECLKSFIKRDEFVLVFSNFSDHTCHDVVSSFSGTEVAQVCRRLRVPQLFPDVNLPRDVGRVEEFR